MSLGSLLSLKLISCYQIPSASYNYQLNIRCIENGQTSPAAGREVTACVFTKLAAPVGAIKASIATVRRRLKRVPSPTHDTHFICVSYLHILCNADSHAS